MELKQRNEVTLNCYPALSIMCYLIQKGCPWKRCGSRKVNNIINNELIRDVLESYSPPVEQMDVDTDLSDVSAGCILCPNYVNDVSTIKDCGHNALTCALCLHRILKCPECRGKNSSYRDSEPVREPSLSPAFDVTAFLDDFTKSQSNKRSRLASRSQEELLSEQQHKTQSPRLFSDGSSASGFQNFNGSHQQGSQQMEFQDPAATCNQQTSNSQGIQSDRIPSGCYSHHPTSYADQTSYYNASGGCYPTTNSSSHDSNLIDCPSYPVVHQQTNGHPPSNSPFPTAGAYNAYGTHTNSYLTNYSPQVNYNQQINSNNQNQQYQCVAPMPNPPPTWQGAVPANSSFSTVRYSDINQQTYQPPNEEMAVDQQHSQENDNNVGIQESHQQITNLVTTGNHSTPLTLNSNCSSPAGQQMFPVQSTDIFVKIVSDGSKRKKDILEDSNGNKYGLQRTSVNNEDQTWQCNKTQNKETRSKCPATIKRSRDGVFRMGTSRHIHQNE